MLNWQGYIRKYPHFQNTNCSLNDSLDQNYRFFNFFFFFFGYEPFGTLVVLRLSSDMS